MKKLMIVLLIMSGNSYAEGIGFDALCDRDCRDYGFTESQCISICNYDPYVTQPIDQECYNRLRELEFDEGFSKYRCAKG